ncbi:FtsQ-type POTRA domain-containing protein [Arthrobacter sp.]|uniref:cell division protein FtsQ/DivIB n=1 Tax=Arthrobacter sp. TaxID=1667 RepID=UPI002811F51F|nr:FtsQ-type POTRA domain-containing protein [Arthrobacter sp.]
MASTRRPTYKRSGSKPSVDKGPSGKPPVGRPQTVGDRQRSGIISASKSADEPGDQPSAPLPDNVVSFPEPRARRIRRNIIITACIVAALVAGLLVAAIYSPALAVRTITVQGTKMLTTEQIQTALEPLEGKPLPQVSDSEVSALLQPLVQIKDVTTQARPPSGLLVQVQERVPVALLKQGETFQLVDIEGVQLSSTTDPSSIQLPVIDGGGGAMGKDLFHAITGVLGALPADVLTELSDASAKSVDAVELKLVDGQTIVWGNAGEKELKAKVLEALLKVPADPKNPVSVYDVSVPRHPVTR